MDIHFSYFLLGGETYRDILYWNEYFTIYQNGLKATCQTGKVAV